MSAPAETEALRGTRLHPPALEAEFRARFFDSDRRMATTVLAMITLSSLATIRNDAQFVPALATELLIVRLVGIGLTFAGIAAVFRWRRPAVLDGLVIFAVVAAAVESLFIQSTRPPDYIVPVIVEAASAMIVWAMLPNRFELQALGGLVITAEAVAWLLLYRRPLERAELTVIGLTLVVANAVSAHVSWRSHVLRRSLFLEHRRTVAAEAATRAQEAEVKRLSALLPICMYCKKIRNESGHWETVEQYIQERTTSKFSHGMCDDCFETHHPE